MKQVSHKLTDYEKMYFEKINISKKIINLIGRPVDSLAISATLETLGYHEKDLIYRFGVKIYKICTELNYSTKKKDSHSIIKEIFRTFQNTSKYFYGIIYLIPIIGQIVVLFTLRYSLWISLDFNEMQQVFSKEGVFCVNHENIHQINDSITMIYSIASISIILIGLILYILNSVIKFFDTEMMIISLLYYILLSFLWIHLAILFNMKHYFIGIILPFIGIIPVHLIMVNTRWGIYAAHLIGLLVTNILAFGYCYYVLKSEGKHKFSNFQIATTPLLKLKNCVYHTTKYFISGLAFYILFCTDRLVSWSVHDAPPYSYFIWFKTEYELGLVWAFLPMLIVISFLESFIQGFSALIKKAQKKFTPKDIEKHNKFFKIYYLKHLIIIVFLGLLLITFSHIFLVKLHQFEFAREIKDFFKSPITHFIFYIASVSYLFLTIGLYNGLIFFTLARPQYVINALIPAVIINIIVGVLLSRWISYEYGIIGLACGSIVYAFLSTKDAWHIFKNMDYYYYAGF